ncbi:MAG: hypothetical protein KC546_02215 [Anaerolineae bacterium]|nr:hypothetical protein [Anaerolineae bacterium]
MDSMMIETRIEQLSGTKQQLLALRLGQRQQAHKATGTTTLAAFVTGQAGTNSDSLRRHLEDRLPQYMVPATIQILDELPRTPNGKIDRQALAKLDTSVGAEAYAGYVEPRNEIEQRLADIWSMVLGIEDISVHDDFFSLGGDSLQATRIAALIEKQFGVTLRITTLFQAPTLAELAPLVETAIPVEEQQKIVQLQAGNRARSPLLLVHGIDGELVGHKPLLEVLPDDQPVDGILAEPFTEESNINMLEQVAAMHVESILKHQPKGPYYLGGYSFGGTLAYEIARQLADQGRQVGFVALFEPYLPYEPQGTLEKVQFRLWRLLHTFQHNIYHLRRMEPSERLNYIKGRWNGLLERRRQARTFNQLSEEDARNVASAGDLARQLEDRMTAGNMHLYSYMIYRYQPRPSRANVVLFTTQSVFGALVRRAIGELVQGDVDSHVIRDSFDHNVMMKPPMVGQLADLLMARLRGKQASAE